MATKDFEAMGTVSEDIPVLDWNAKIEDTGSDDEAFSLFRLLPEGDYDFKVDDLEYTNSKTGKNMVVVKIIIPQPEKALAEIRRVLKDDGVLIAPTFTHGNGTLRGRIKLFFMKLAGFPLNSRWSSADYLAFLRQNGWTVRKSTVLKASFPLTYAECVKPAVKGRG